MKSLISEILDGVAGGRPPVAALERLGEADSRAAADALAAAWCNPDLVSSRDAWGPAVLESARPGFAAAQLEALCAAHRESRGAPLDVAAHPALPRLLGTSNFLARRLVRCPELCDEVRGEPPESPSEIPEGDWSAIRQVKYRGLVRIVARDLLGAPYPEILAELSALADRCLVAALGCAARECGIEPPDLLALGKLGGRELNFSSDVDVMFVDPMPADGFDPNRHEAVSALVRSFKRGLEDATDEGFAYRVDLDLRPEGPTGVLVNSVGAALDYYETFGAEWERQMLIRLRVVAGSGRAAEQFRREIEPFVYRRSIDPGATRAARAMKTRIEEERRNAGRNLDLELKEGPGGIRDVEFLVQELQLFYGGRNPAIRSGNVLEAIGALTRARILEEGAAASLTDAYLWLRRAEHSVQIVEERQTHRVPEGRSEQVALARRMGYRDADANATRNRFLDDWTRVRAEARAQFDALVLGARE